ncbi:arrestin domain-containing protein 17 [Ditylenchus destructor]|nr:arrestin domain-containing protein 17 [Ditylenchus destructor]
METVYESKELILDEYKDLTSELALHCSEALEILEGQHKITFRIKLPLDVVSSIEKENHGLVKYTCMAVLDVPEGGDSEIVAECDFGVVSLLNLDAPHFCLPTSSREQVNIIGFCCHRPKGYISADVAVSELGLLPGETVRVCLTVENTVKKAKAKKHTGMHQCALLSLCQQLDFRAANRQDPKQWDHKSLTTAVHSCGTCKANQVKGPETKYIDFVIPNGLPPTSAKAGGLVVCSYFFRLDMAHFDVIVPLPLDVVSSIEKENHGLVKYTCMAVLDVPEGGDSEIVAECDFGVVSLLNLDAPHFCLPTSSREQVNIIGFCCHRPKGYISADVAVSELGLLPGETVRVCLTVENTVKKAKAKKHTGMHQCALLSLCQQLDFRAANRQDPKQWDHKSLTTAVHSCGTCKANQVKGPETKYIDFVIPNGLPPTSAKAGGLVVCSYFFRLDMAHFDVIVPVIIGSQKTLIDTGGPQATKD